jgi:hypothetical protein
MLISPSGQQHGDILTMHRFTAGGPPKISPSLNLIAAENKKPRRAMPDGVLW